VETNLGDLDKGHQAAILASLMLDCGLSPDDLRKAHTIDDGPLDPRYPEITILVRKAMRDWDRWGKQLVATLEKALDHGRLLPMSPATEAMVLELLRDHEVAIVYRLTGRGIPDQSAMERLVASRWIEPGKPSLIETSWRLGRGLDMRQPHAVTREKAPTLEEVVRRAMERPLTRQDTSALEYCQRNAAVYMRRPAASTTAEMERVLNHAELAAIKAVESKAIEKKWSARKFASELAEGLQGHPTLINDLRRVARTELVFAQCHGAYTALKEQMKGAGIEDPQVFKMASPFACVDCKRIWGLPGSPIPYRLSEIENREAQGGNFRKPRAQWGPCIGPIHPNCTEGPLQHYDESLIEDLNEIAKELSETYDRS